MGKNERVNNSQSTQVDNSQPTSQVDNTQPTSQVCPEIDKPAEKTGLLSRNLHIKSKWDLKGYPKKFFKGRNLCKESTECQEEWTNTS